MYGCKEKGPCGKVQLSSLLSFFLPFSFFFFLFFETGQGLAMFLRLALIPSPADLLALTSGVANSSRVYQSVQFHMPVVDSWDLRRLELNGSGDGLHEVSCQGSCSRGSVTVSGVPVASLQPSLGFSVCF